MKFLKPSILFFTTAALLASCKGDKNPTDTAAKLVPESASMVLSIDMGKLAENKLTVSKIAEWTKSDDIKKIAAETGVDSTSRVFGFLSLAGKGIDDSMGGFLFKIADNKLYKTYIAKYGEVAEENGVAYIENEHYFAASNGTYGLFLAGHPSFDFKAEGIAIMTAKPEETILSDEKNMFASQQGDDYDLALWINGNEFTKVSAQEEEAALVMSSLHLNEYFSTTSLKFEAGEIVVEGKTYGSDAFNETYKSFMPGNGVVEATSSMINGEGLSGYLGLKVDPKGFEKIAAIGEFKPMVDEMLSKMGLELNDILGALTGDVAASFNGVVDVEQEKIDYYAYLYDENVDENAEPEVKVVTEKMPDFTLALGVADKEKFDKLMNLALLAADGDIEKLDEGIYFHKESGMGMIEKNGNVIVSFTPTMNKIKEGKVTEPSGEVISNLSSYPAYYYFNLDAFLDQVSKASPEAAMGIGMGRAYVPVTEIEGYATADNDYSSKFVIKMKDSSTNSLEQLVDKVDEFFNGIGQMMNGMM